MEVNHRLSIRQFLNRPMLWKYSLPYSGYIDAPADLAEARRVLAEKIKADPYALINKLEPAEPSAHTLVDLGKRVFGVK